METADVLIIGAGVLGGSIAYYLAKQNAGRVLVLEKNSAAQGNSSLAAGLLTRGRFKAHHIPFVLETYQAINEIEHVSGRSLAMRQTGCLYAAISPRNQSQLVELAAISKSAGLKMESLDETDAAQLLPWLKLPPGSNVIFMPDDGYIDGYQLTSAYLRSAAALGVEVVENTLVHAIQKIGRRVTGVLTDRGEFSAGLVIDAAGIWAGLLALELEIALPMAPIRSHYWVTDIHDLVSPDQPFLILPDARAYARPESNRLLFGLREQNSVYVNPRELPAAMPGYTFKQDPNGWDSLLEGLPAFSKFVPFSENVGIAHYIKGFSNYTPDGEFILGAYPDMEGFMVASGCNGAGIAISAGAGRAIADLVTGQPPFTSLTPHRPDRFGTINPLDPNFLQRCAESRSGKISG
jgi:4-methylaminobutanoate oxidase (formaldehyde-forming)